MLLVILNVVQIVFSILNWNFTFRFQYINRSIVNKINPTIKPMTFNHANVVSSLPTNACCTNWIIDDGNVDKIPAKIMIEIPLPTPV